MSAPRKHSSDNPPEPYRVGYKRPPLEHRFRKGQSGNPSGRPKGAQNKPVVNNGFGMRAAEEYLKQEAYRTVTVREGENHIELPAIQAVFRAMGVAAMKGNRFAQKTMAELVTGLEQRDADARMELFGTAVEYKQEWSERIAHCKKHGLPVPEPLPHPDDIILNPHTGEVRFHGPQTPEEKAHHEEAVRRRQEAQDEVHYYADKYRRSRSESRKAWYLDQWHYEQRIFDIINDALNGRHKLKLENRSYRPGASREGETFDAFLRKQRKDASE